MAPSPPVVIDIVILLAFGYLLIVELCSRPNKPRHAADPAVTTKSVSENSTATDEAAKHLEDDTEQPDADTKAA